MLTTSINCQYILCCLAVPQWMMLTSSALLCYLWLLAWTHSSQASGLQDTRASGLKETRASGLDEPLLSVLRRMAGRETTHDQETGRYQRQVGEYETRTQMRRLSSGKRVGMKPWPGGCEVRMSVWTRESDVETFQWQVGECETIVNTDWTQLPVASWRVRNALIPVECRCVWNCIPQKYKVFSGKLVSMKLYTPGIQSFL